MMQTEFITDEEIYRRVILEAVSSAQEFLWLGTSDLKDLHVHKGKQMYQLPKNFTSFVEKAARFFTQSMYLI
jgi:hypothetical protein